ncbi:hypothetical protein BRC82_08735 [Halobacteriales archaeon QS_1_67_19]|nr:MAG: hypothetical protein BRC82_08735 [Halobacteriales archaeon QS_1_67_19]
MTRTRTRLALVGIALLGVASGVPPQFGTGSGTATAAENTFVIEQGNQCYEVSPLNGNEDVVSFYDYRSTENGDSSTHYTYSSYMPLHLQAEDVSRLFLYDGPNGVSLVIVHNQRGNNRDEGSAVTFRFSGLPGNGNWVLMDDTYSDRDDRFSRNRIDWSWYGERTDGAVFRGLDQSTTELTIDPAFNEQAALYDRPVDRNGRIRAWQFLTGNLNSPNAVNLDMSRPITVRTGHCGPDETPPTADLSAGSGVEGYPVSFDARGSTDNRAIAEYRWDFDGDGTVERTTNSPTVSYTYDEPGTYDAAVTVVDGGDNADAATVQVDVEADDPPDASLDAETGVEGYPVSLDASGSSDEVGIAEYRWDLDRDGEVERTTSSPTIGYTYDDPGTYDLSLTVVDASGRTATVNRSVTVEPDDPPEPAVEVESPEFPVEGQQVVLNASGATDDVGIAEYRWSLGDNATATGERVAYTYAENGTYSVTLEVVDTSGQTASETFDLEILPPDETPPDAAIAGSDRREVEAGANVSFDAGPSSDDRTIEAVRWAFGDGAGATGERATHTYGQPGVYNATVFVTDGGDNTANASVTVEVLRPRPPSVSADVPDAVSVNETVRVEGAASDNGAVAETRWDFAGQAEASGPSATHTFTETGDYVVTFTAIDRAGNVNRTTERVTVRPPDETPPNASLSAGTADVRADETMRFDAANATDNRRIAEYRWDFDGDGEVERTTSDPTVEYAYDGAGNYSATVRVVDGGGNADEASVSIRVEENEQAHGGGGGGGATNTGPPPVVIDTVEEGPNAATLDVRNAQADERVRGTLPESAAADETGVQFEAIEVGLASDDSHFAVETARATDAEVPADATLGALAVDAKYLDAATVETVTYEVTVQRDRLEAAGLDPGDLAVYRRTDGEWTELDADVRSDENAVTLAAETGALAPVAVGADVPATLTAVELGAESVAADEPVPVTGTVENEGADAETFAANLTVDGEVVATKTVEVPGGETAEVTFERALDPGTHELGISGRSAGTVEVAASPDIEVTNVSVDSATISAGTEVEITATVENDGSRVGERNVTLTLFGEAVATKSVEVPADGTANVTFVRRVDAPGNYTAKVGDASAQLAVTGQQGEQNDPAQSAPDVPGFTAGGALAALVAAALLARRHRER